MGNIQFKEWEGTDIKMMLILLVASKKALTRKWLKPEPPTLEEWMDILLDIYKMEKLTFCLRLQSQRLFKIWSKWFVFVKPIWSEFLGELALT